MLIGGMFDVDIPLLYEEKERKPFSLRCDVDNHYSRIVLTNNGRTATTYAFLHGMKLDAEDEVLLPDYNCISVINAVEAVCLPFAFYRIDEGFCIDLTDLEAKITPHTKVIYIIHYFGVPQPEHIVKGLKELAKKYHLYLVEDLTQTLMTVEEGRIGFGDYLVSSVRKWYQVTDGGVVAARDDVPFEMVPLKDAYDEAVYRQMALALARTYYHSGALEDKKMYLRMEKTANKARYYDFEPRQMTEFSRIILEKSDHEACRIRRRDNYQYLYDKLKKVAGIQILSEKLDTEGNYVPFGLQIMVSDRDDFYQYLTENMIIGEIQWILPVQYYEPGPFAQKVSDHSLMLQIDQRYGKEEMDEVVRVIGNYFEKKQ